MIKIITAKNSGFCFGVKRAVEIAQKLSSSVGEKSGMPIYTNGPIIHNPQVINHLKTRGITTLEKSDDAFKLKKGILIIRTHGIKKNFTSHLAPSLEVVDATCPFVKRAQEIVKKLDTEGRKVIILGDSNHPEVEGLLSYSDKAIVVKNLKDVKKIPITRNAKIGFLSQTTQSTDTFDEISRYIKKRNPSALIYDTICRTTSERQKEVENISRKCDIMIIVGGKNSANTRRLAEIARKYTKTYHIETAGELSEKWFSTGLSSHKKLNIDVAAGASTPDWIIKDVISRIRRLKIFNTKNRITKTHPKV